MSDISKSALPEPPQSPLEEATSDSLDELFSRDPLGYSKADIETIIAEQRAQRARWMQVESAGGKRMPGAKAKTTPGKVAAPSDISLDKLGL